MSDYLFSDCPLCGRALACGWWCLACGKGKDEAARQARFDETVNPGSMVAAWLWSCLYLVGVAGFVLGWKLVDWFIKGQP